MSVGGHGSDFRSGCASHPDPAEASGAAHSPPAGSEVPPFSPQFLKAQLLRNTQ